MAFTAAERAKRYREKMKQNPEKYEAWKKKSIERLKSFRKKMSQLTKEEKVNLRELWRQQKLEQKQSRRARKRSRKKNAIDASTMAAGNEDMVEIKVEPHDEEKAMASTAAERSKRYREKIKQDPEKYEAWKKKMLERSKKRKNISQLTEEEAANMRELWREQKRRQKQSNLCRAIEDRSSQKDDLEAPSIAAEDEDMVELKAEPLDEERAVEDGSCQKDDVEASSIAAEDEDMVELKAEPLDEEHATPPDPLSVTNPELFSDYQLHVDWPAPVIDESSQPIAKEEPDIEQESPELELKKYKALYFETKEEIASLKVENQRLTEENQRLNKKNEKLTIRIKNLLKNMTQRNKGKRK